MASLASQIILHPTVGQGLKFGATTLGRDKIYRAVQYFARFYAWHLTKKNNNLDAARWTSLKSHLATARKLMRLGKPIEHLQAALKAFFTVAPCGEQITTHARQLSYFGYLSLDAIVWANTVKFYTLSPETAKKVVKTSFRLWFAGIVFSIVNGALKSVRLTKEARRLRASKTWGEKDLADEAAREANLNTAEAARKATRHQLIIDLLDVCIPATGAELVNVNEGTLGLLGLISSLMGAQTQWNAIEGK